MYEPLLGKSLKGFLREAVGQFQKDPFWELYSEMSTGAVTVVVGVFKLLASSEYTFAEIGSSILGGFLIMTVAPFVFVLSFCCRKVPEAPSGERGRGLFQKSF